MPTPTDAMTPSEFAARIDHTILKPELDPADVDRVIEETEKYGFASACLPPTFVKVAAGRFRADKPDGTETIRSGGAVLGNPLVCTVVGFPHGTSKPTVKAIEATAAVKDGADEVDMVIFLPNLIAGDVNAARAEVQEVVRGARAARPDVVVKVIVESAALLASVRGKADPERMIADACRAVREGGADYIKTSTGFHPAGGASVEAVAWMKKHADGLKVKASGGIRDLATAKRMLDAGADRLGLSASVAILGEMLGEAEASRDGGAGY